MKVLVTGAGGFLGSHICQHFISLNAEVLALGRFYSVPAFQQLCRGAVRVLEVDLPSPRLSDLLVAFQPDLLVHCASSASVPLSMQDPLTDLRQSAGIYGEILDAVRLKSPNTMVTLLSSASVYGQPITLPTSESAPEKPLSPYGHHKWMCEILSHEYATIFGIKTVNLRIFSAYGERLYKQVVYDILTKLHLPGSDTIELFGTGEETRDFIHGSDVAFAIECIFKNGEAGTFNIATGSATTIGTVANHLIALSNSSHQIHFKGTSREGDPDRWQADISKLQSLGFTPKIQLEDGLSRVVNWYQNSIKGL